MRRRRLTPEERIAARVRARWRRADYMTKWRALKYTPVVEDVSREDIIKRDGQNCHICGEWVSMHEMTFDHVIPLSKGGTHTADNIRIAHMVCNSRKGAR
jgi:5-methylcytosine-specific restriction endonuclease McrA